MHIYSQEHKDLKLKELIEFIANVKQINIRMEYAVCSMQTLQISEWMNEYVLNVLHYFILLAVICT